MLNEIQIALLPKGFHPKGLNRRQRRQLAKDAKKKKSERVENEKQK